jgi:phage repressor protein C with HTH and peptisase S24 domain
MGNFSDNIVNQRFKRVYEVLEKRHLIKGKSDIAKKIGTYNHVVNSILKGDRNVTVEQLHKLFEIFNVDANFMFGFNDNMFSDSSPADLPTAGSLHQLSQERSGRQNIVLVPFRAMAGYALEYQDDRFFATLPRFSLPNMEGSLIAFEISGDSMHPTITSGDIVVCEALDRGDAIRDNHIYVVVTDVVVAKRVQQLKNESGLSQLRLISDNSAVYQPYKVDIEDIRQILKVKCRLTAYAVG